MSAPDWRTIAGAHRDGPSAERATPSRGPQLRDQAQLAQERRRVAVDRFVLDQPVGSHVEDETVVDLDPAMRRPNTAPRPRVGPAQGQLRADAPAAGEHVSTCTWRSGKPSNISAAT